MNIEDKIERLIEDLEREIKECRIDAAKLSSKSDILERWKIKIQTEVLNEKSL